MCVGGVGFETPEMGWRAGLQVQELGVLGALGALVVGRGTSEVVLESARPRFRAPRSVSSHM